MRSKFEKGEEMRLNGKEIDGLSTGETLNHIKVKLYEAAREVCGISIQCRKKGDA